jgi:hypothetical protein
LRKIAYLIVLVSLLIPNIAVASSSSILDRLVQRLSPVEGMILGNTHGNLLILDTGREKGINPGDLFSVYRPGKTIVHPVTGKKITLWDGPFACLEVIKAEEGYSLARLTKGDANPEKGWKAVRFKDMSVTFQGPGKEAEIDKEYIRARLPYLNWSTPADTPCSLNVEYSQNAIKVSSGMGKLLAFYKAGESTSTAEVPKPSNTIYSHSTTEKKEAFTPFYRRVISVNEPILSMDLGESATTGNPVVVYHNDREVVLTLIRNGKMETLDRYLYKGYGKLLTLFVGDCNGDGIPEVVVNTFVKDEGMDSFILRIRNGKLTPFLSQIPYYLIMEDTNSDGDRETLIAQHYNEEAFLGGGVYTVKLEDHGYKLIKGIPVPQNFKIPASFMGDLDDDGIQETAFTSFTHKIFLYKGTDKLWNSIEKVGGSLITVRIRVGQGEFNYEKPIAIDPPLLVYDANGDGKKEILVVRNKSQHGNTLGDLPLFSGGEVLIVEKKEIGYVTRPVTGLLDGPIQNISIRRGELWCTIVRGGYLKGQQESHILAFPIQTRR